ncbi:hypothetical protein F8M41_025523 [Gigaspora margarita]|uniref:Uncharacterized protein n=1 Tax=Gigaspora margarita TaxID=4874 RepID=A0A8H4AA34_GIGMA|nr:hypothetical protein F8M41_025523 [Gigaspora margarita]
MEPMEANNSIDIAQVITQLSSSLAQLSSSLSPFAQFGVSLAPLALFAPLVIFSMEISIASADCAHMISI